MYTFIKEAHSGLAYLVLLGFVISAIYYFVFYSNKKALHPNNKTLALITLIVTHLQVVFGLILYFISPITKQAFNDFGAAMKSDMLRTYAVEHPLMMIVVVVLVTIAHKKVKTAAITNSSLGLAAPILFLVGLAAALAMVPWNAWLG